MKTDAEKYLTSIITKNHIFYNIWSWECCNLRMNKIFIGKLYKNSKEYIIDTHNKKRKKYNKKYITKEYIIKTYNVG